MLRRHGPRPRRNDGVGEDTLRDADAARRVVRLARRDRVAESLGQNVRPIRAVDAASQLIGDIREVARLLGQRWHREVSRLDALRGPCRLKIAEEEQLSFLQRTADGPARLVLRERRPFRREVVAGVERSVAEELERVASKGVAARFGDNVDDATVVVAVFRIEVVGEQPKLLDRVEIGHDTSAAVHPFLHVAAVHVEAVGALALATDRDDARIQTAGRIHRTRDPRHDHAVGLHGRGWNHARLNREEVRVAAAVQRQRGHRRRRNDLAELRRDRVDADGVDGDVNGLALFAQFEGRVDLHRAVGIDRDAGVLLRLESLDLQRHVIAADRQLRKGVQTLNVGDSREHRAEDSVGRGHAHAWDYAAARILDDAR